MMHQLIIEIWPETESPKNVLLVNALSVARISLFFFINFRKIWENNFFKKGFLCDLLGFS